MLISVIFTVLFLSVLFYQLSDFLINYHRIFFYKDPDCSQDFLDRFHALVLPTAENESWNLLVSSQKTQTEAMKQMAEQFSVQMADSFEKVITPNFQ